MNRPTNTGYIATIREDELQMQGGPAYLISYYCTICHNGPGHYVTFVPYVNGEFFRMSKPMPGCKPGHKVMVVDNCKIHEH